MALQKKFMTSSELLLNQDFCCVFFALHWQKKDSWKDCKSCDSWRRTSWIKALRDVQTTHLCDRKHPWCSRPKKFLWCNVTPPRTEPECIYAALGLSQRLFCLPCRLQNYRLLGSSSGYQSKPGGTFSSPLYSSPVPIGDVAFSQPRHTASDIIHYMKVI